MDIRFEKREHLQEKPDQKNLGFGKHFTDYMFCHGLGQRARDGMMQQSYRTAESRWILQPWYFTNAQETIRGTESLQNSRRKDPAVPSGNERTPYD